MLANNSESRNIVMMETGCKLPGGVHAGNKMTIGANSVILDSVEPNQTVFGIPARVVPSSARTME
jgi:serine acetyltransferase